MTLKEYYNIPEEYNCTLRQYFKFDNTNIDEFPSDMTKGVYRGQISCIKHFDTSKVSSMKSMFYGSSIKSVGGMKDWDVSNVTDMSTMFNSCTFTTVRGLKNWDTSNVTTMKGMFSGCTSIKDVSDLKDWDVSNVTDMSNMFDNCQGLTEATFIDNWDTSKVTDMSRMFYIDNASCNIVTIGSIDCSSVSQNKYPLYGGYSSNTKLKNIGGFPNMKSSWTDSYGLAKIPNLTYESCINILNGLYDFAGNGETPNSNQGKLKVHSSFLTKVGDEISIGTSKGWTITA